MSRFFTRILTMSMTFIFALTLSGCATTNKVTQDYKPDTDFRPYKTFSWHNFSSDVVSADQVAIQRAVEQQLNQQGFELVSGLSDLVLDLTIIKQAAAPSSSGIGLSIGLPIGRHGSIGLGTSKLLGNDPKTEALIIVDITAQASHQILWRGTAESIPLSDFTLQNQVKLNARLRDLLQQFPPK
jgi:Domain of unknown function (DUF4136)